MCQTMDRIGVATRQEEEARSRLKSRRSFLTNVQPVHFPAKVVRVNEWKRRLEEKAHAGLVNLYEDLATGHDSPWLNWRCLNILRTGYTYSKEISGDTSTETQPVNAGWQQKARLTCYNAHSSHTPAPWTPSRVQRYSSSMHRAMEEDSLMTRYDDKFSLIKIK